MFDREPLLKVEATIKSLRQERARLSKIFEAAKTAAHEHEDSDVTMATALSAKEAVNALDSQLDEANQEQVRLLKQLGDYESGQSDSPPASVVGLRRLAASWRKA